MMISMPAEARAGLAEALGGLFDDDAAETLSAEGFSMDVSDYLPIEDMETAYLHGNENWRMFDFYGPVFIGIFLFVFTFITSGMSLVTERMGGTMTRFLATPVNAGQILGGYTLGLRNSGLRAIGHHPVGGTHVHRISQRGQFGARRVHVHHDGHGVGGARPSGVGAGRYAVPGHPTHFALRCAANSAVRAVRPFRRADWLAALSSFMPVTYGVDALRAVMLRGADLAAVGFDLAALWGFLALFFALAAITFRKKRARTTR